jgi:hypothetical protein
MEQVREEKTKDKKLLLLSLKSRDIKMVPKSAEIGFGS